MIRSVLCCRFSLFLCCLFFFALFFVKESPKETGRGGVGQCFLCPASPSNHLHSPVSMTIKGLRFFWFLVPRLLKSKPFTRCFPKILIQQKYKNVKCYVNQNLVFLTYRNIWTLETLTKMDVYH